MHVHHHHGMAESPVDGPTAEAAFAAPAFTTQAPQFVSLAPPQPSATPSTQELLASVLQQMTAAQTAAPQATSSGELQAIAPYLALGATLDHKLKIKIWEGVYVELGALASTEPEVSVAVRNTGEQTSISLTTVQAKPPATILEWLQRFATFAAVYLERHPAEAPSVFTYMVSIVDLHRRHGFVWRFYIYMHWFNRYIVSSVHCRY